jgi:hypothetical protein
MAVFGYMQKNTSTTNIEKKVRKLNAEGHIWNIHHSPWTCPHVVFWTEPETV